jgi:predicted GNAT family acetyltransferase
MDSLTVDRQHDGAHGAYVATVAGIHGDARLHYRHESPGVIAAVHTETPDALRGRGVALKLVERLVEDARSEGTRIHALCSYVDHQREKHPEWADVFVTP